MSKVIAINNNSFILRFNATLLMISIKTNIELKRCLKQQPPIVNLYQSATFLIKFYFIIKTLSKLGKNTFPKLNSIKI